jgi:hypothetical protein
MIAVEKDIRRFIFSLDTGIYKEIRKQAYERNTSMAVYVLQAIMMRLETEKVDDNKK